MSAEKGEDLVVETSTERKEDALSAEKEVTNKEIAQNQEDTHLPAPTQDLDLTLLDHHLDQVAGRSTENLTEEIEGPATPANQEAHPNIQENKAGADLTLKDLSHLLNQDLTLNTNLQCLLDQ